VIIETDDYIPLMEAARELRMAHSSAGNLARDLGLIVKVFGVRVVKKTDVELMRQNRRGMGNPRWIEDFEAASAASYKAIESRERRKRERTAKKKV
jgi:hypothetical protein